MNAWADAEVGRGLQDAEAETEGGRGGGVDDVDEVGAGVEDVEIGDNGLGVRSDRLRHGLQDLSSKVGDFQGQITGRLAGEGACYCQWTRAEGVEAVYQSALVELTCWLAMEAPGEVPMKVAVSKVEGLIRSSRVSNNRRARREDVREAVHWRLEERDFRDV